MFQIFLDATASQGGILWLSLPVVERIFNLRYDRSEKSEGLERSERSERSEIWSSRDQKYQRSDKPGFCNGLTDRQTFVKKIIYEVMTLNINLHKNAHGYCQLPAVP